MPPAASVFWFVINGFEPASLASYMIYLIHFLLRQFLLCFSFVHSLLGTVTDAAMLLVLYQTFPSRCGFRSSLVCQLILRPVPATQRGGLDSSETFTASAILQCFFATSPGSECDRARGRPSRLVGFPRVLRFPPTHGPHTNTFEPLG